MSRILVIALLILATNICLGQTVATVGSRTITAQDISLRVATEAVYGHSGLTSSAALVSLINDAIEREVAASLGVDATVAEITQLGQHANTTSKAPQILSQVKAVYEGDTDAYNRLYLAPKVVNRKLREYYGVNVAPGAQARSTAETVLQAVADGNTLEQAAGQSGLSVTSYSVAKDSGQSGLPPSPLAQILDGLNVGDVYSEPYEDSVSFQVIKLVSESAGEFSVESIVVNKPDQRSWLQGRASTLTITISDASLRQAVQLGYSSLWWVSQL